MNNIDILYNVCNELSDYYPEQNIIITGNLLKIPIMIGNNNLPIYMHLLVKIIDEDVYFKTTVNGYVIYHSIYIINNPTIDDIVNECKIICENRPNDIFLSLSDNICIN